MMKKKTKIRWILSGVLAAVLTVVILLSTIMVIFTIVDSTGTREEFHFGAVFSSVGFILSVSAIAAAVVLVGVVVYIVAHKMSKRNR